jgi:hypothetical protein
VAQTKPSGFWARNRCKNGRTSAIAVLVLYSYFLIFPKRLQQRDSSCGDNFSSAKQNKFPSGKIPNWCPYIMGGMPGRQPALLQ